MSPIVVRDITKTTIDDVFRVCSHGKLNDPLQKTGIELRRRWLSRMLSHYGPCTKIAYLDERPVAQAMYYPEEAAPFIRRPRPGVVLLRCVYNPFPEARGKGAASSLIRSLVDDCRSKVGFLKMKKCSFIASELFNTGEGTTMESLYTGNGFFWIGDEMIFEISGGYVEPLRPSYSPRDEDYGKAIMFYDPTCEYSYSFAVKVEGLIHEIAPDLPVELVDKWEDPYRSRRMGNLLLIVNSVPIVSSWRDKDRFADEVLQATKKDKPT